MSDKNKAYLRLGAMGVAFVALIALVFINQSLWVRVPSAILAGVLGYVLFRTFLAMSRKKHMIYGKVLSVTKPTNKFKIGKTVVVVKSGKVSKKLYTWQQINLKVGNDYGFYYEDKSNQILKYETMKMSMVQRPKTLPPQFR